MPQAKQHKKKTGKTKKIGQTKIILVPTDDIPSEDEYESGMFLDKEEVHIIYNALREYKPTEKEEHLHGILLEEFEEILVVDYNEPYPDAN
jgi:hypothetical protein